MSTKGIHIDGKLRGFQPQRDVASPQDRPPYRVDVKASAITTTGKVVEFPTWSRWLHVEDDGGGELTITTQDGSVIPGRTGSMIFLPNTRVRVAYVGQAPTATVVLCGYNADDAAVVSSSAGQGDSTPSLSQDITAGLETPAVAPANVFVATQIPGSAPGKSYYIQAAPIGVAAGLPPFQASDESSLICVASSQAKAELGQGIYLAPGGDTTATGEVWICEVAFLDPTEEILSMIIYREIA